MVTFNIEDVAINITPPRLRSYEFQALILVLLKHHKTLSNELYEVYERVRFEMAFNGQVIYLEHVLNDYFDVELRRIRIADLSVTPLYLFNQEEDNEVVYFFQSSEQPVYLNNKVEMSGQFVIYVPAGQILNFNQFRSICNKYKLQGKTYQIIEE